MTSYAAYVWKSVFLEISKSISFPIVWQIGTFHRSAASSTSAKPRDGSQRFEPSWTRRPFFAKPSESYARQYESYPSLATDSSSNGLFAFYASSFYARNARKMLEIIKPLPSGAHYFETLSINDSDSEFRIVIWSKKRALLLTFIPRFSRISGSS